MLQFNRAQITKGLADYMLVKGNLPFTLDETISSNIQLGDISETPHLLFPRPICEEIGLGATVGALAVVGVRPAANKILQIRQIVITNLVATQLVLIQLATGAQIAALGAPISTVQFADVGNSLTGTLVGSQLVSFTPVAGFGNVIGRRQLPATSSITWDLPLPGISLFGNDDGGRPGLFIAANIFNTDLAIQVFAREWPLPGQ